MNTPRAAEFYRLLHTGNAGDVEFYQRVCGPGKSVLELGCGWGRIAEKLLEQKCSVVGVDTSDAFLEAAQSELQSYSAGVFVKGDLRTLSLLNESGGPRTFDRVLIPYNTLYSLGGTSGVLECFRTACRHLAPGGEVWCDFYPMDDLHAALLAGEESIEDDEDPVAEFHMVGQPVRVLETSTLDATSQHLDVQYRALSATDEEVARLEMSHDYLILPQIQALLLEADLAPLALFGDFEGSPPEEAIQIVLGAEHRSED